MLSRRRALPRSSWLKQAIEDPGRAFTIGQTAVYTLLPHRHRGWNQRRLVRLELRIITQDMLTFYRD